MRILKARDVYSCVPVPSAATIGMFDGVHRGHHAVLAELRAHAAAGAQTHGKPLRSLVITFQLHPKSVVLGHAPASITSLEHRLILLERAGIDATLVLEFDEELRSISADDFMRDWLHRHLGVRVLVLGWDSKFGKDQKGNIDSVAPIAAELGIGLFSVPPLIVRGRAVSSTAIREAITLGDLSGARAMLGRNPGLLGHVVHGDHRGRELGFPTANLELDHELHPPHGVYVVRALVEGEEHRGVMNIGLRPTIGAEFPRPTCEVHLLGFEGELYGKQMEVSLLSQLRTERKFSGLEELKAQIARDVQSALEYFEHAAD